MASCGDSSLLDDKDIMQLSHLIFPDCTFVIAVSYLNLSKIEAEFCKTNARMDSGNFAETYNFKVFEKWKQKMGMKGTRKALYELLVKASKDGHIDRNELGFLYTEVYIITTKRELYVRVCIQAAVDWMRCRLRGGATLGFVYIS